MMFLLLQRLHLLGSKVAWIHAIELARASFEKFDDCRDLQRRARALLINAEPPEVLLIDDIGKERFNDSVEQNLYRLIEIRALERKPILWTSNLSGASLREIYVALSRTGVNPAARNKLGMSRSNLNLRSAGMPAMVIAIQAVGISVTLRAIKAGAGRIAKSSKPLRVLLSATR